MYPTKRLRRLRSSGVLRDMLAEVELRREDIIAPVFVQQGLDGDETRDIPSMPGVQRLSIDSAAATARRLFDKGISAVLLFGIPEKKDALGSGAWDHGGAVQQLTRLIKNQVPEMLVVADVCLCEYTDHGHCGPVSQGLSGNASVDNDSALELLQKTALSLAEAGCDIVAPSAMMDGQVAAIRETLDRNNFTESAIMSYAVKYSSSLYGPFRDAAGSYPAFGDRKTYQMDYRSSREAIAEAQADVDEGVDILMVKPAGPYMDIIRAIRDRFSLPLAAYHVSGEYSMISAAAQAGWLDERAAAIEILTGIKRSGADIIITYFAEKLSDWLSE